MATTDFTFSGTFDPSPYHELLDNLELQQLVHTRFLYQMGSIERTHAKSVTTHFEYNGKDYRVIAQNPERA